MDCMESERLCAYLEDILRMLGVTVRYDDLKTLDYPSKGGICRMKGQKFLFIDKGAGSAEKLRLLTDGLNGMDLEGIYIKPAVRAMLNLDM